jgi:hypothetical protein
MFRAILVVFALSCGWSRIEAQATAVVMGTVRSADANAPLPYAGVLIPGIDREALTNDRGAFAFFGISPGTLRIRLRHVGFTPVDTQLIVAAGDTLRLQLTMKRLAIRLDAMRVMASCASADSMGMGADSAGVALAALLDQVRENAAQFSLLVRAHPFTKTMGFTDVDRYKDGTFKAGTPSLIEIEVSDEATYKRGRVFRTIRGVQRLVLPTLLDFADREFLSNHCFAYGGETVVDTNRYLKLHFAPVPGLKDPDIEGTVTLNSKDYTMVSVEMRTTTIPASREKDIKAMRVVTHFREIFPGIPVASVIESFIAPGARVEKQEPNLATRGEVQIMERVRWKNGPP